MCFYDDMDIQLVDGAPKRILYTLYSKKSEVKMTHCPTDFKSKYQKIFVTCRLWLFIYLLVSPASGIPVHRRGQKSNGYYAPHLRKALPREGIGIVDALQVAADDNLPVSSELSTASTLPPSLLSSSPSPSTSANAISDPETDPTRSQHHLSLDSKDILKNRTKKENYEGVLADSSSPSVRNTTPQPLRTTSASLLPQVPAGAKKLNNKASIIINSIKINSLNTMSETSGSDGAGRSRRAPLGEAPKGSCGGDSTRDVGPSVSSWDDPCGGHSLIEVGNSSPSTLSYHIDKAIVEANSQVNGFIEGFSKEAFNLSWSEASNKYKRGLSFLSTAGDVNLTDLQNLSFENALKESYELMQRRAVGIEQVTLDQALYQSSCLSRFRTLEMSIIHILCQIRHAMYEMKLTPRDNVTADIMTKIQRCVNSEHARNIRDTIILREYISSLHSLHSVFRHFL